MLTLMLTVVPEVNACWYAPCTNAVGVVTTGIPAILSVFRGTVVRSYPKFKNSAGS